MKKVIYMTVICLVISNFATAQASTKLICGQGYKIAIPDQKPKDTMLVMYMTGVAKIAANGPVVAFEVERSVAEKINATVVPDDKRLVLFVYNNAGRMMLGSYELETRPDALRIMPSVSRN
jgi:hypothetical protein